MQKTIVFLGGAPHQISPIKYAKSKNIKVVICDSNPNCAGMLYANKFYNVSIKNKNEILKITKKEHADGILSYATEIGATTQAFVAQKLNLPSNPYKSVQVLSYKNKFRSFLKDNKFYYPQNKIFKNFNHFKKFISLHKNKNFIIKPVDSSGSKGIFLINDDLNIKKKFDQAIHYSQQKKIICEEFVKKIGPQIAGDGFIINKKLNFFHWADQYFNNYPNNLIPVGESWPSTLASYQEKIVKKTINKILKKLKINFGAFNFDMQFIEKKKLMIIEIGPRNGGDFIPEATKLSTGVDMIKLSVDSCLGNKINRNLLKKKYIKPIATFRLNSKKNGKLKNIKFSKKIKKNILKKTIYVKKNSNIKKFLLGKNAVGSLILKFKSQKEMIYKMKNIDNYIKINLKY